jgi:hypothetical protein
MQKAAQTTPVKDMERDPLEGFMEWFFQTVPALGAVPLMKAVHMVEGVTAVTWYRDDVFQVQMFAVPPHTIIPEHVHPNVDSFEVYVGGTIRFAKNGQFVSNEADEAEGRWGTAKLRGKIIRVLPTDRHGSVVGEGGGVFLSVQRWLNGVKPHCVAADYVGKVMGPHHFAHVIEGVPIIKAHLTPDDAVGA